MSAGAILCLVFAVCYALSSAEIAERRRRRRALDNFEHTARMERLRDHQRRTCRQRYPEPPEMPGEPPLTREEVQSWTR
jgi:hypothetical protein